MHFQFVVAPPTPAIPPPSISPSPDTTVDLLKQLLEVQREQTALLRTTLESRTDGNTRRSIVSERWLEEFPHLPRTCRDVVPVIERAFLRLIDELAEQLLDPDGDVLEGDFQLNDFLDRYAIRLSQLGTILHWLGPIADTAPVEE